MKKFARMTAVLLTAALAAGLLAGCGGETEAPAPTASESPVVSETPAVTETPTGQVASAGDMSTPVELDLEGLEPVYAGDLKEGTYEVAVDSSSSMFKITSCQLTVENGELTAVMTMGGTGYLYVYPGTAEEAAEASEDAYISYTENPDGTHSFTLPVTALDEAVDCAAYSKKKELWYDRTLVFRADSLPAEAFAEGFITDPASLNLADGEYTVEVSLEGGSGRATVESPARLTVENGSFTAEIIWGSSNYDYMKVGEEQYFAVNTEGNSTFEIPVTGFDYKMPVLADTTAMSQPYEIQYTLYFDSATIQAQK